MTRLPAPVDRIGDRYDVVVVGSVYGGGVAACRLAAAGKRVCVLERGREIRPGEYPNDTRSLAAELQLDLATGRLGSATALFDFRVYDDLNVAMGCGLGGTSLINAGLCLVQGVCVGCGDCISGCNYAAKNTVLATYLPQAKKQEAEIFTGARVTHLDPAGGGWRVCFQVAEPGGKRFSGSLRSVAAGAVVLGAGALGSTEVLLRSRAAGLALSPALGYRASGNGDMVGLIYNADWAVNGVGLGKRSAAGREPVGACSTGLVDGRIGAPLEDGYVMVDGAIPGELRLEGDRLVLSWHDLLGRKLITGHPLGGCAMAEDARDGVVDHRGRVYAGASGTGVHDGLYMMDAAVVPRSLGVNPLLLITALAERSVDLLLQA